MTRLLITGFVLTTAILCVAWTTTTAQSAAAEPLPVATDGDTTYQIVWPAEPTSVDQYTINHLGDYLKKITGAAFTVIEPGDVEADGRYIFIGMSGPVRARLDEDNPIADLKAQEHVARSKDKDIFLYGEGMHGNLSAVFEFLETSLGWRWYSQFMGPVIPDHPTVELAPFHRKRGFDYRARQTALRWGPDFYYQLGFNMGYESRYFHRRHYDFYGESAVQSAYRSVCPVEQRSHTLHRYLPPNEASRYADSFNWLDRQNYFEVHPEWFSLNEQGERVPRMQVCFSNPNMRAQLTQNILRHAGMLGEGYSVALTPADYPGKFCHCEDCLALEEKYQSAGGAFYDYLFELCDALATEHPHIKLQVIAYRRAQTQVPPAMPAGRTLPDNLIVTYFPVEDNVFADWTHPDSRMQESYQHFRDWSDIVEELWIGLYPNPWGAGALFPFANIDRLTNTLRLAHEAGAVGFNADNFNGYNRRGDFVELQVYLLTRLMRDVDTDVDAVVGEFTDYFYGDAASGIRKYLEELEAGRKAMSNLPEGVSYNTGAAQGPELDSQTFPYLTPENIHRWQQMFEDMEAQVSGEPTHLLHVRLARRELDIATLNWWFPLQEAYPDHYTDHEQIVGRIEWVHNAPPPAGVGAQPRVFGEKWINDFVVKIEAGGDEKPLPARFDGIDDTRIRTFLPLRHRGGRRYVQDADAAKGLASVVDSPNMPFGIQFWRRDQQPSQRGATLSLDTADITPGEYQLFELGRIEITPSCRIAFGRSHQTHIELGERLHEPGADNLWDVWVSMKFNGPTYGGEAKEDQVVVDRIIMVRVTDSQF